MKVITLTEDTAAAIVLFLEQHLHGQRAMFGGESLYLRELANALKVSSEAIEAVTEEAVTNAAVTDVLL